MFSEEPNTDILVSTKGGAGGATTTVSTLPQLSAAAAASGPGVIVVSGAISGAAKVSVGSDKTIVGKAGSCMFTFTSFNCCLLGGFAIVN